MSRYSLFLIFIFLFGLFFCLTQTQLVTCQKEPFTDNSNESEDLCPNLLIKKGSKYYLQNTKKVIVPGVNPIAFNTLDEYEEFIKWQRSQNIKCPILFVEYAYNTQNHPVYFIQPNPPFSRTDPMPEFTPSFKNEICNSLR
tara:strand:+ start:633 stop:1055 length:423 start_codon:yes stop_codon:yes gene_type:complete